MSGAAPELGAQSGIQPGAAAALIAEKDPAALRTIGEVASLLGLRQHVLRYWEEQFSQLRPLKRTGGRRYYRPEDVSLIETIDRLVHREGYTLKGAQRALAGGDAVKLGSAAATPASATAPPGAGNFALRARMIALRAALVGALHEG